MSYFDEKITIFPLGMRKRIRNILRLRYICIDDVVVDTFDPMISPKVRRQFTKEAYEGPERRVVKATISQTDRVLELGAGCGFMSTLCSKLIGSDRVVCVEANPRMEETIKNTHKLNGVSPLLKIGFAGVGESETLLNTGDYFLNSSKLAFSDHNNAISVPVLDIDKLIIEHQPTYIIIDVEGAEIDLVPMLVKHSVVKKLSIEVHQMFVGSEALNDMLKSVLDAGFKLDFDLMIGSTIYLARN